MANIIFLDIDGVLNNRTSMFLSASTSDNTPIGNSTSRAISKDCLGLLAYIVQKTGASLVITSTWRNNLDSVKNAFVYGGYAWLFNMVLGKTPYMQKEGRGKEIESWLLTSEFAVSKYAIIDDDCFDIHQKENLFQTEHEIGLTVPIALNIIEHFKG